MSRALLLLLLALPASSQTEVRIKLAGEGGQGPRHRLALAPFSPEAGADEALAAELREFVRGDLMFSRYFEVLENVSGPGWRLEVKVGAPAGKLSLSARLVDAASGEASFERYYRQDVKYKRSAAHRLSDDVVQAATGRAGIAHSQIAFVNDSSGSKEVWLVDYDGANPRQITRHGSITLLPRLSPDRRLIAYTTYKDGNPDLFVFDLEKGQQRAVSAEQGLNIAGGFSPDGTQLLMTLSRQKSPNLFVKNLADGSLTQLTQHFGADSSPTFSPDAAQVAFVSDRAGNPQIYILDMATQRARRLTNLNWCDSPTWSPTGEWIAFAGRANPKDRLDIFLVDVTGNQIRQVTRGEGSNENPSWSPDGRFLTFVSTRGGRSELYAMDADGSAPHRVVDLPGRSFTPHWSR